MPMNAVGLRMDEARLTAGLQEALAALDGAEGEVILDFSSVRRIDGSALQTMERLAAAAEGKALKVALQGVDIAVYRVLKLMKLAPRFVFRT